MPGARLIKPLLKAIAALAALGVLAVAALLLSMRLEHTVSTTLPVPTGPFAVGRAIYDWSDDQAVDPLAPVAGTKRELLVWIWYPAAPGQPTGQSAAQAATDDYLPAPMRIAVEQQSGALLTKFLTRDRAKVRTHSLRDAAVSTQQAPYPVVIMRGGASAEVWNYSTLAEDLASHGYVVVGFDASYRSHVVVFPDGRVITRLPANNPERCLEMAGREQASCAERLISAWTSDIAFVLDRLQQLNASDPSGKFTGRLDLARVGAFGHSFGGATAAQFCSQDSRCKAGADVDGILFGSAIQAGIHQPFMFLLSDHSREHDPETAQIHADMQSVYDRLPPDGRAFLMIRGANHFLFSNDSALLKSHILMRILRIFGIVRIDGPRQLAITSVCLHTFFDVHLKNAPASQLASLPSVYPELRSELQ
jgi:dienelactone hydrolase